MAKAAMNEIWWMMFSPTLCQPPPPPPHLLHSPFLLEPLIVMKSGIFQGSDQHVIMFVGSWTLVVLMAVILQDSALTLPPLKGLHPVLVPACIPALMRKPIAQQWYHTLEPGGRLLVRGWRLAGRCAVVLRHERNLNGDVEVRECGILLLLARYLEDPSLIHPGAIAISITLAMPVMHGLFSLFNDVDRLGHPQRSLDACCVHAANRLEQIHSRFSP